MISAMMQSMMEDFCIMEKRRVPDGEGGFITTWENGAIFEMATVHNSTILAQQAEGEDTASTFRFYVAKQLPLAYPDVVKRLSDGETFLITSDSRDNKTPDTSKMNGAYVNAKKWRIPE